MLPSQGMKSEEVTVLGGCPKLLNLAPSGLFTIVLMNTDLLLAEVLKQALRRVVARRADD